MVAHPARTAAARAAHRFIAFNMATGCSLASGATANGAYSLALRRMGDDAEIEILDCGDDGRKVWAADSAMLLIDARQLHATVFRGDGFADSHSPLPAIQIPEGIS